MTKASAIKLAHWANANGSKQHAIVPAPKGAGYRVSASARNGVVSQTRKV